MLKKVYLHLTLALFRLLAVKNSPKFGLKNRIASRKVSSSKAFARYECGVFDVNVLITFSIKGTAFNIFHPGNNPPHPAAGDFGAYPVLIIGRPLVRQAGYFNVLIN